MRVLIATGGTGGHIFPAISVAEEVRGRVPDAEFLLMGASKGSLNDFCSVEKACVVNLPAVGMPRRVSVDLAAFAFGLVASFDQSLRRVASFRPHVAVGFGNFASFAPLLAAKVLRVPIAIHEANAIPGKANLLLSRFCDRVLVNFPCAARYFPDGDVEVVGMPLRKEFTQRRDRLGALAELKLSSTKFTLLVVGGSQGARALNMEVCDQIRILQPMSAKVQIIHLTGERDYLWVKRRYAGSTLQAYVAPFETRMKVLYDAADVVLARAGASTIAEIIGTGKPAILVPFPHATARHQDGNARYLEKNNGAVVLKQRYGSPGRPTIEGLGKKLLGLIEDRRRLQEMADNNCRLASASPGGASAAEKIADALMEIARPEAVVYHEIRRGVAVPA